MQPSPKGPDTLSEGGRSENTMLKAGKNNREREGTFIRDQAANRENTPEKESLIFL